MPSTKIGPLSGFEFAFVSETGWWAVDGLKFTPTNTKARSEPTTLLLMLIWRLNHSKFKNLCEIGLYKS